MAGHAAALNPIEVAVPAPVAGDDPAQAARMRRMGFLDHLAAAGQKIGGAIRRLILGPDPEDGPAPDRAWWVRVHARVSRAVQLATLLQFRLIAELSSPATGDPPPRGPVDQGEDRKPQVGRSPAHADQGQPPERERTEGLAGEDADRRAAARLWRHVMTRPVDELILEICQGLGLSPDWARLADEPDALQALAAPAPGELLGDIMARASTRLSPRRLRRRPGGQPRSRAASPAAGAAGQPPPPPGPARSDPPAVRHRNWRRPAARRSW